MAILPLPEVVANVGPGGPIVTGMMGANALTNEMLKNQMQQIQNQYLPQSLQSEIAQRQAQTGLLGQQAQYFGPEALARIGLQQAQAGAIPSEVALRQAQLPILQQQASMEAIKNQYLPQQLGYQNQLLGTQAQFAGQNALAELAKNAAQTQNLQQMAQSEAIKNRYLADLQQAQIKETQARAQYMAMGGGYGMGAGQKELLGLQRQIQMENPDFTPQQTNEAASAYINGQSTLSDGTKLSPASGMVQSMLDQITKRGATTTALNQQRYAATLDNLFTQGQNLLPSVIKYAGALGTAKGSSDRVAASLGANSPDYANYLYFTRQYIPQVAGEMGRALGANATDMQKKMMSDAVNPATWDSNPAIAMQNWNRLVASFRDVISPTIAKSTGQIKQQLRQGAAQPSAQPSGPIRRYNPATGMLE